MEELKRLSEKRWREKICVREHVQEGGQCREHVMTVTVFLMESRESGSGSGRRD